MSSTQTEKAARFLALHTAPKAFVIANAWDAGSARILAGLGYEALATSSGACAGTLGRRDGRVTRDEALAHARAIVAATDLPVSADLEKGFGDSPADTALTIRLAGEAGLAGGSIEDASGDKAKPLYDLGHALERIAAAAQAARALHCDFMLTARAENFVRGNPDIDDTIRRLQSFEAAGADVLMAPGLPDLESIRIVCASLKKPFNFMAKAVQLHGRYQGQVLQRRRTRSRRRQAHQPRHLALSRRNERHDRRGARGKGQGKFRVSGGKPDYTGAERVYARIAC